MTTKYILGREPAVWSSLIMAAVALLVAFGIDVSTDAQGLIQAFVNAVLALVVVGAVRENILPAAVAVVNTTVPLVVAFGLHLTPAQQGAILAIAPIVLNMVIIRPQVTAKVPA